MLNTMKCFEVEALLVASILLIRVCKKHLGI